MGVYSYILKGIYVYTGGGIHSGGSIMHSHWEYIYILWLLVKVVIFTPGENHNSHLMNIIIHTCKVKLAHGQS